MRASWIERERQRSVWQVVPAMRGQQRRLASALVGLDEGAGVRVEKPCADTHQPLKGRFKRLSTQQLLRELQQRGLLLHAPDLDLLVQSRACDCCAQHRANR